MKTVEQFSVRMESLLTSSAVTVRMKDDILKLVWIKEYTHIYMYTPQYDKRNIIERRESGSGASQSELNIERMQDKRFMFVIFLCAQFSLFCHLQLSRTIKVNTLPIWFWFRALSARATGHWSYWSFLLQPGKRDDLTLDGLSFSFFLPLPRVIIWLPCHFFQHGPGSWSNARNVKRWIRLLNTCQVVGDSFVMRSLLTGILLCQNLTVHFGVADSLLLLNI